MMPGTSGLDVLAAVKNRSPMTEVILVTAFGSLDSAIEALRQGAHDYLVKPFDNTELRHSVHRALDYRRVKLEKQVLLDSLQHLNDELTQMLDASNRLAHLSPLPVLILDGIVEIAERTLGLNVAVTALDDRGEFLENRIPEIFQHTWWARGLAESPLSESYLRQLFAGVTEISRSFLIEPDPDCKLWPAGLRAGEPGVSSAPLLAVPFEARGGRMTGVLWVVENESPASVDSVQRLEIFGNQIAGTLENANLYVSQLRQVRARNTLVKAGQRIATVLDRQEVMHTVLEAALKVMPQVELAFIFYRSNIEAELSSIGLTDGGTVMMDSAPIDESLVNQAVRDKRTVYQSNWVIESGQPVRSLIIEPLVLTGMPLGALAVISRPRITFDDDHGQILTMLASHAAIALQNAWLYAEAQRVDEIEALFEAENTINRTLDLQETLTTTMSVSRSLTGPRFATFICTRRSSIALTRW